MSALGISGGLGGKILRVDLDRNKIWTESTEIYASRFIGGRTINSFILLNEMDPGTKWSDPENMLVFGAGCLAGTPTPGACRLSIDTKNVFGHGKGSANVGGNFAAEMKYAGFDHVVITGQAEKPLYLWMEDGQAELREAADLWGKMTSDTEETMRTELGDEQIEVACIGPAGENLVKGSAIIVDGAKAAGGSGVGCVMGSKKLKALAVRGRGSVRVAKPERFLSAATRAFEKIEASPRAALWRNGGAEADLYPDAPLWDVACVIKNGQDEHWPLEKREKLMGPVMGIPRYKKRMTACISCPIGCMPYFEIEGGKYKGMRGSGYWLNSALYSPKFDVDDAAASITFHLLANQLGLDGDMASVVSSWAFECYEKGLLTREDTGGLGLEWGNDDAMIRLEEMIAHRRGLGDLLADGVKEASRRLAKGSERFALHVKDQDTFEPYRIMKGFAFAVATSPVGGRHLRGAVSIPSRSGPRHIAWSPTDYESIPDVIFWQLRVQEMENAAGVCVFMGTWSGAHALEPVDYMDLINAALGISLGEDEFMLLGQRGYNLEKAFNTIHAGYDRKDDYPPRRFMEEPVQSGPHAGSKCDKETWDKMLDRFYELHGWDQRTGLQTREGLTQLGLEDVAEKLKRAGKLVE